MSIPPELTNLLLGIAGVVGGVLGTFLVRRGKKEDVRLAEKAQTFEQLETIVATVGAENARLRALVDKAEAEKDRIRLSWEERWERQMRRCREVTDSLVKSIAALELLPTRASDVEAVEVLRQIQSHNQDDHPDPAPNT